MKCKLLFLLFFTVCLNLLSQLPKGFVYVTDVVPNIKMDLRYYTLHNFVGKPVDGYNANKLILTQQAAMALKLVQAELEAKGYCLKVFDAYRPQRAVNHFMSWAKDLNDTINKKEFYPNVNKKDLFAEGYIASHSGHSRGSTLDITIMDIATNEELDMGSPYDFFGKASWVDYQDITERQKANRSHLQNVMIKYGFRNYPKEWWHFTLKNEPFPDTYFDFAIE